MPPMLPIETVVPDIQAALQRQRHLVLQAPPGAGKTTKVPLELMAADWLTDRRIVVLEPRRLAARAAAGRMATLLGESVGQRVGYHIRHDRKIGSQTRIEVVTEGILTRRLQNDPSLSGVGLVIFDEFHERSLNSDLALALCLEAGDALRDDLRIIVMSATLDGAPVSALMKGAPVITSHGKSWPVETHYDDRPGARERKGDLSRSCAHAVEKALAQEAGDMLVFLPGQAEIRQTQDLLKGRLKDGKTDIRPLYGNLTRRQQDTAIRPSPPGRRKVVLATTIAETSLTIDGIRVVVDTGFVRTPRFDPRTGMSRLETHLSSRASADQRRGRAGRTGPGACYRLWPHRTHHMRRAFHPPEILQADLASLALELAAWGVRDPGDLRWLDPPPPGAISQARGLLAELEALDSRGTVTAHGRKMAALGVHPRLAHMILRAEKAGAGALACLMAAMLSERDFLVTTNGFRDADLRLRMEILADRDGGSGPCGRLPVHAGLIKQIRKTAGQLARRQGIRWNRVDASQTGRLLAFAYPDRIAMARGARRGDFRLSSGSGARFFESDPLAGERFIVAAEMDGDRTNARIYLAAPYGAHDLQRDFGHRLQQKKVVAWDKKTQAVVARTEIVFGELAIDSRLSRRPDTGAVCRELLNAIRKTGLRVLPWHKKLNRWRGRIVFLRHYAGLKDFPDMTDRALASTLESWLQPFVPGISSFAELKRVDLAVALGAMLTWKQAQQLDHLAPSHITVPSGSRIPLDYTGGDVHDDGSPVLAVRVQEMFGLAQTPRIAGKKIAVTLHLLSPAGRPVQVTRDLASFWKNTYPEVKKDLMGRYPKHYWPQDPLSAQPTRGVKRPAGRRK